MDLETFKRTQYMTEEEYNDYAYVLTKEQIKKTINDVLKDYDNKLQERINYTISYIEDCKNKLGYCDEKMIYLNEEEIDEILEILKGDK